MIPSLPELCPKHFGFSSLEALLTIYIVTLGLCEDLISPAEIYISFWVKHVFLLYVLAGGL